MFIPSPTCQPPFLLIRDDYCMSVQVFVRVLLAAVLCPLLSSSAKALCPNYCLSVLTNKDLLLTVF